jgi:hypothetical protein
LFLPSESTLNRSLIVVDNEVLKDEYGPHDRGLTRMGDGRVVGNMGLNCWQWQRPATEYWAGLSNPMGI